MVQLAKSEQGVLAECEEIIERGLESFIEVGNALLRIRSEKLYRVQFDTFEIYCSLKWGMSRPRAYQMIQAAEIAITLSTNVDTEQPTREAQLRPLAKLPPPVQREAWKQAVGTSKTGKPTAKEVTAAVLHIVNPTTTSKGGDSDEVCWRRGLIYRTAEATAGAAFEDWKNFRVDSRLVADADRAAEAWKKLGGYLRKLHNEQKKKGTRAA